MTTLHALAPSAAPAAGFTSRPSAGSILSTRAMLRGVRISLWDGRKLDRAVSEEVNRQKGADANAGRFNKALVPPEELAKVKAAANRVRTIHGRYCLPWTDNGLDILPAAKVQEYDSEMRDARREFEAAADEFAAGYPAILASAPDRLGDLFNPADFPTVDDVRARFSMRIRTLPMPDAADFRVDVSDAQARQIREELRRESREALETAMRDAWQRVADVCGRMVERLEAYKPATRKGEKAEGIFRDSLVENVRELVHVLPAFNLSNDPVLADVADRMARELCAHDAAELRDDSRLRDNTAKAAASILATVSEYLA